MNALSPPHRALLRHRFSARAKMRPHVDDPGHGALRTLALLRVEDLMPDKQSRTSSPVVLFMRTAHERRRSRSASLGPARSRPTGASKRSPRRSPGCVTCANGQSRLRLVRSLRAQMSKVKSRGFTMG